MWPAGWRRILPCGRRTRRGGETGARLANRPLDDWLGYFGLRAHIRHNAVSDAFATAEIMLILLARAARQGLTSVSQLRAVCERQQRLLPGGRAGGA